MPDPILNKLGAYLDGELNDRDIAAVESHLETCPECRSELDELRQLSGVMMKTPDPDFIPAADFRARLMLQLPRREETANAGTNQPFLVWLIPVLIILVFVFIQVTMRMSSWVSLAHQAGLLDGSAGWAAQAPQETLWYTVVKTVAGQTVENPEMGALQLLNNAGIFSGTVFITLLIQIAAAIVYWSVMVVLYRTNRGLFQAE